eukprot:Gb_16714 [translate_table: standard]
MYSPRGIFEDLRDKVKFLFDSGIIPSSITNMKDLGVLDLSDNKLYGEIPSSLGNCLEMVALKLTKKKFGRRDSNGDRANYLEGEIPLELTSIKTLQILDVSQNNLSGPIPHNLAKLTAMTHISERTGFWLQKLRTRSIPSAIQEWNGLITLNLSRNHLNGDIPDVFGVDMQLNSLDLFHNHLSGKVPVSLQLPGSLGVLNLSYNRLCGRILVVHHLDTFGEDSYVGNPCLCGPPLNTSCWHGVAPPATEDDDKDIKEEDNS